MVSSPDPRIVVSPLTEEMLVPLDPRCRIVQFSSLLTDTDFARLRAFLADYPDVALRAYGDYDHSIRDLEFLRFFPELRHVHIDVWDIDDLTGLHYLRDDLDSMWLGATRSTRFSLAPLRRFRQLRTLHLEGHTKDIVAIGDLSLLEDLTLRSITLPDLSILLPLERLRSLDLKLGGIRHLELLPQIGRLEYLELWKIKGLTDISAVGSIPTLQSLFLQALRRVEQLPTLSSATALRRVHLETMRGTRDLSPLRDAPALEELLLVDMGHLSIDDLQCLVGKPSLERVLLSLGSLRKNAAARELFPLPAPARFSFQFR